MTYLIDHGIAKYCVSIEKQVKINWGLSSTIEVWCLWLLILGFSFVFKLYTNFTHFKFSSMHQFRTNSGLIQKCFQLNMNWKLSFKSLLKRNFIKITKFWLMQKFHKKLQAG